MKAADILKLINAGYTKADIEAMEADTEAPAETPKEEEPAPAEEKEKEAPASDTATVLNELKALKDQISKMNLAQKAADIPDPEDKLEAALKKLLEGGK